MKEGGFCAPSPPSGTKWDAAKSAFGMEDLMKEVDAEVDKAMEGRSNCCGLQGNLKHVKVQLDAAWLSKIKEKLKQHGLTASLHDFWIYNGNSSSEHLYMYIYELKGEIV